MNNFSSDRQLNIKKVVMVVSIALLFIVSVTVFIISKSMEKQVKQEETKVAVENQDSKTEIFYDVENTVSIEIPKKYGLKQAYNSEYLIKLSSEEDNIDVYVSRIEKIESRDFASIARADKLAYLEEYNSYSNLSDLKELEVNGNKAYTYSFHYLDENLKKAFYIQVVLLELDDAIYIFDIDFPLNDLTICTNLTTEVLEKFLKY